MTQLPKAKYRKDYQAPEFTITDVDLTFDLHPHETRVKSVLKVVRQGEHKKPLVLDGEQLTLLSIKIDGEAVAKELYRVDEHSLTLKTSLKSFTLEIENSVNPTANEALEGLYLAENTYCTQCEAEGFRRITYYLDRPDVLAKFTTTVIADKAEFPYLLSNGNRVEHKTFENGKHLATWQDPFPKPCYLFALVAGNFDVLRDEFITREGRTVDLELFVDKGNLNRADHAMLSLKNAMKWDEERFDLVYDLDIYMVVAVDFFNMGAMENKGLNVFNAKYVLANPKTATDQDFLNVESVIGHEYFHNWTGNRVTCRDWFQLSLKEGLTVFRDQEFSSDLGSRAVNRIQDVRVIRSHQFAEDAGPMAHPIRPDKVVQMNNFYTVTVYNKGAEVIRMIHTLLGEEGFQKGMKLYFERHDGKAVTCEDFVEAMEDANDQDFGVFRNWYSQAGTPVVTVEESYDEKQQKLTLVLKQSTASTPGQAQKAPFHIPVKWSAYNGQGKPLKLSDDSVLHLKDSEATFIFDNVAEKPILSLFDNFSAPVRVKRSLTEDELRVLLAHSEDDFSRWDAAQSLFIRIIEEAISNSKNAELSEQTIKACQNLLRANTDPALKALALTLPTAATIADRYDTIPVEAINIQLKSLKAQLAVALESDFNQLLSDCISQEAYKLTGNEIAKRQLKQVCLGYLAELGDVVSDKLLQQFKQTDNLTDQLGALQASVWANHPISESLLNQFEEQWRGEKLVMDKWFSTQSLANHDKTVERVKDLMTHPDFSLKNPNRIYSLLAAFTQNQAQFHRADGAGYKLIGNVIQQLNTSNPQVASRLLSAFVSWRRYDENRQQQMKTELESLRELPNLASDLFEKIESCLSE
ncbi:aminopeptidase N [Idiomarina sp. HP20-50]|uniref:aminopeptidase N n=1 Tax=Idiomarina sp. HP20-50 TaxID=3070813 RepID=UPI00294AC44F|nr:aminopeptidase N [Idiomarina sp. HP20-50]MDV6315126.1 aminopeptidase N [Idiomarina sp. HP20-50]